MNHLGKISKRYYPFVANQIGSVTHLSTNISTDAARFAINTGLQEDITHEGTEVNAFRHTLWQATIDNQFGNSVAKQVGNAHENNPFVNLSKRVFTGEDALAKADQTADLLNNQLGRSIGEIAPQSSMKDLSSKVLDYFHKNGLYTAVLQKDDSYSVKQTNLTDQAFSNALKALQNLNTNGFTPNQQKK